MPDLGELTIMKGGVPKVNDPADESSYDGGKFILESTIKLVHKNSITDCCLFLYEYNLAVAQMMLVFGAFVTGIGFITRLKKSKQSKMNCFNVFANVVIGNLKRFRMFALKVQVRWYSSYLVINTKKRFSIGLCRNRLKKLLFNASGVVFSKQNRHTVIKKFSKERQLFCGAEMTAFNRTSVFR